MVKMTIGDRPRYKMSKDEQIKNLHETASILSRENTNLRKSNKEANEFIKDIATLLGMDADGIGYDGLQYSIDDFKEAIDKLNKSL
jgi:hypothetical protein